MITDSLALSLQLRRRRKKIKRNSQVRAFLKLAHNGYHEKKCGMRRHSVNEQTSSLTLCGTDNTKWNILQLFAPIGLWTKLRFTCTVRSCCPYLKSNLSTNKCFELFQFKKKDCKCFIVLEQFCWHHVEISIAGLKLTLIISLEFNFDSSSQVYFPSSNI